MFSTLQELFEKFTGASPEDTPAGRENTVRLAAAVLLVEVMKADTVLHPEQRQAIRNALVERFGLDEQELGQLIAQAESQAQHANDFFH